MVFKRGEIIFSPFLHLQFGDRNIDVEQPLETHEIEFKIESIWGDLGIFIKSELVISLKFKVEKRGVQAFEFKDIEELTGSWVLMKSNNVLLRI